jgi:hypothetical protein
LRRLITCAIARARTNSAQTKACALELPQPEANSPPYYLQQRTPLHSTAFRNPLPQSRNSAAHYNTTPNYRNLAFASLPLQARLRINYTTRRERRNKHRLQKIRILTAHHNVAGLSEVQVLEAKSIFAEAKRRQFFPRAQSALSQRPFAPHKKVTRPGRQRVSHTGYSSTGPPVRRNLPERGG